MSPALIKPEFSPRPRPLPIPAEYESELCEKAVRRAVTAAEQKHRKQERNARENYLYSNDTFAFIAGDTPAEFAYGTTWEELGETLPDPMPYIVALAQKNLEKTARRNAGILHNDEHAFN